MSIDRGVGVDATLAGSAAFRGLGGAPTVDGLRVAAGRLYRADALAALDATDRAVLDAIGLRLVCDLRGRDERERTRCLHWLQPAPRVLSLELSAGLAAATASAIERMRRGPDAAAAAAMMRATYATLPRSAAPFLGELFGALAAGELPVLVHCTAGKDRTGFSIALILTALGVEPEFIYSDYLHGSGRDPLAEDQPSAHMLEWLVGRRLSPDEAFWVHGVHREYLDSAFAAIERDWGSVQRYLEIAAGLDAQCSASLRERLLVRPSSSQGKPRWKS